MASYCVERRHSGLGSAHSRFPSDQIVMSCIFKMSIHPREIVMPVVSMKTRKYPNLAVQVLQSYSNDSGIL